MAASPNRVAANQANARRSTGPKSPEGKARSSQNARKHPFNPDPFAIVRIKDRAAISTLVADGVPSGPATYQPINPRNAMPSNASPAPNTPCAACPSSKPPSSPTAAVEVTQLGQAMSGPAEPFILNRSELANGIDIPLEQHRAYWLAFGFNSFTRQSNIAATFLRFQAQAEHLHRRAVEDFRRLLKLRGHLPPEKYEDLIEPEIEPKIEPIPAPQPAENTAAPPVPGRDSRPPSCAPS